jgi:hypothetical protein
MENGYARFAACAVLYAIAALKAHNLYSQVEVMGGKYVLTLVAIIDG